MKIKLLFVILIVVIISFIAYGDEKEDKTLQLKIGDEGLKDKVLDVSPGKIYSSKEGKAITFEKMIDEMKPSWFVYVGESHDSLPMHSIQLKIIQALYGLDRSLSVGLEMLPVTFQESLNKWSLGILSKSEFVRDAKWYVNWNLNFRFYEKIFEFSKDNGIQMRALNAPRELITKIRMKGWDALSPQEQEMIPQPKLFYPEHKVLIRTIFETAELPHQMKGEGLDIVFEGLYHAQSAWDETMAFQVRQSYERNKKRMVVLAGSGHLLYNLGINRRVFEKNRLPFKTVIAVEVPKDKGSLRISRSLADYIWGIDEEERPVYPSIGLKLKKIEGMDNLIIESAPIDGVALGSDFEKGDVILSVGGEKFTDINELRIYLAEFAWENEVAFCLLRNTEVKEVVLKFKLQENKQDKDK